MANTRKGSNHPCIEMSNCGWVPRLPLLPAFVSASVKLFVWLVLLPSVFVMGGTSSSTKRKIRNTYSTCCFWFCSVAVLLVFVVLCFAWVSGYLFLVRYWSGLVGPIVCFLSVRTAVCMTTWPVFRYVGFVVILRARVSVCVCACVCLSVRRLVWLASLLAFR